MSSEKYVTLNTGAKMNLVGYGTWQAVDSELEEALEKALEVGYRHIDTAALYQNEHVIGKVLNRWLTSGKVNREDLFITTKLPIYAMRAELVSKRLQQSLTDLQLEYVDLYLVHMPFGTAGENVRNEDGTTKLDLDTDHVSIWKALEAEVDAGKTKAIGLSNFNQKQIQNVLDNSRIKPANLQIELHVYLQQRSLVEFCKSNNITVTSYSTLGSRGAFNTLLKGEVPPNLTENETVLAIAQKHKRSAAQVLLRFVAQQEIVVIPKSTNKKRLEENFQITDFSLSEEDMESLGKLDKGEEGRLLRMSIIIPGLTKHPQYPYPY